jgi:hypothetical protein
LSTPPLPSLSAASNILRMTSWPKGDSLVSTKAEITFECCAITSPRSLLSSSSPISALAPLTMGAKMPLAAGFRFFSAAGFFSTAAGTTAGAAGAGPHEDESDGEPATATAAAAASAVEMAGGASSGTELHAKPSGAGKVLILT